MITRSAFITVFCLLTGWMAVLAGVGLVDDSDAPSRLVLLPTTSFLNSLPDGTAIVSIDSWTATLVSTRPGFARDLYRSGAWLVLPAGLRGCGPT